MIISINSIPFCVEYEAIGLWKGMGGRLIFPVSTWRTYPMVGREQASSLCFGLHAYNSAKLLIHILSLKCQHSKTWIWHPETDREVHEHKRGQIIPWCTQQGGWNIGQGVCITTTSIECRTSVVIYYNLWNSRYACIWPERQVWQTEKIMHSKHHAWW